MIFILQRISFNAESTIGNLFEKTEKGLILQSFVIEDQPQAVKVKSETRIPAGFYELRWMKAETPLTLKHRIAYNKPGDEWFKWHIEITGIPNFSSVYFHSGVSDDHSAGCVLNVDTINNNQFEQTDTVGARSIQAVKRFYQKVGPLLDAESKVFLEVRDEDKL